MRSRPWRSVGVVGAVLLWAASGGAGGAPEAPDVERLRTAARHVLHGTDAEFRGARQDLATWDAARLLRLVDALRAERFGAGAGQDALAPQALASQALDVNLREDASPEAQAEAPALAKAANAGRAWQVRVDAHPLRLDARVAARWLGAYAPEGKDTVRVVPTALAQGWLRASGGGACLRPEPLPTLWLADGQGGVLASGGSFRYVMDYSLSGSMVLDQLETIVGTLREGLRIGVRARRGATGARIELDAAWTEVIRPVATFQAQINSNGPSLTLDLPELRLQALREAVDVGSDAWILLAPGKALPAGVDGRLERRLVLLRTRVVAR